MLPLHTDDKVDKKLDYVEDSENREKRFRAQGAIRLESEIMTCSRTVQLKMPRLAVS